MSWLYKIKPKLGTGVLPGMALKTATNMQAHLHSAFASTKHPEEAWQWVRFLSTPFYQSQFCKSGLWPAIRQILMTEEGLSTWITPGVHPEGYKDIPTKFLPNLRAHRLSAAELHRGQRVHHVGHRSRDERRRHELRLPCRKL